MLLKPFLSKKQAAANIFLSRTCCTKYSAPGKNRLQLFFPDKCCPKYTVTDRCCSNNVLPKKKKMQLQQLCYRHVLLLFVTQTNDVPTILPRTNIAPTIFYPYKCCSNYFFPIKTLLQLFLTQTNVNPTVYATEPYCSNYLCNRHKLI